MHTASHVTRTRRPGLEPIDIHTAGRSFAKPSRRRMTDGEEGDWWATAKLEISDVSEGKAKHQPNRIVDSTR
jgi:hypothetical protein